MEGRGIFMKLSQREKQLLWGLINIGVLLFGVKVAFPKINDYHQAALEKLQTNENYALEAEILLGREKELPENLEQYKTELAEEASYYFSKLDSEYMEAWIMEISKRYPINIRSLNIEAAHSLGEDSVIEVLPISMALEGEEQTLITFLDALVQGNRHVVIESLQLDATSAQVRMALYRIEKESDPLDETPFNQPPGKISLIKPPQEEVIEPEIEPEKEQTPEEDNSNLSALENLLGQLLRPQENGNSEGQPPTNGGNEGADPQEEIQNKSEIEGDKDENAAQALPEGTQAETAPSSNS